MKKGVGGLESEGRVEEERNGGVEEEGGLRRRGAGE
jgi:hypothetical protein